MKQCLYKLTKAELVEIVLAYDKKETREHANSATRNILMSWIAVYRRYSPELTEIAEREA